MEKNYTTFVQDNLEAIINKIDFDVQSSFVLKIKYLLTYPRSTEKTTA